MRGRTRLQAGAFLAVAVIAATLASTSGDAVGASSMLARYPYLSDPTPTSVEVTWATANTPSEAATAGFVTWGPAGSSCNAGQAKAKTSTYSAFGATYVQHTAQIGGATGTSTALTPSTAYCYHVWTGSTAPLTDLVGSDATVTTSFTTLPSDSSQAFSFDVLGDWGTTSTSQTAGTYNAYQHNVDAQLKASTQGSDPALFAVSTGDIAYNDGTPTNYGDAIAGHAADVIGTANTSDVFDPRYWGQVGSQLPLVTTTGNHGRNGTFLSVWPESALTTPTAGYPAGRYALSPAGTYPPVDGYSQSSSTPDAWYAFTVGAVRFYIIDADWTDISQTAYPTLGGGCVAQAGSKCPTYQLERDEHWLNTSAEYQWLSADLAHDQATRGDSALRFAFFHYPIHVDQNNWTTAADVYLQNSSQNPYGAAGSLEALLNAGGVRIAFNGHAHLYERNIAPVGGVMSYVTGGGGGVPTNVISSSKCSTTDAYARGWDMTHNVGSQCGTQSGGTALSQAANVYHFLKVRVSGSDVTVTPTDSLGNTFDAMTYHFGDVTPPTVPSGTPSAVLKAGTNQVTISGWGTSADAVDGTASAYDVYRDGGYVGTVTARRTSFVDTAPAGAHRWTVRARDFAGNQSGDGPASNAVTVPDVTPPTAPTVTASTGSAPGEIDLAWSGATDDVGVTAYAVYRDGSSTPLAQPTGTTYADTSNDPGTTHSYAVVAKDAAGNASPASAPVSAVAGAAAVLPPLDVSATQAATSGQVNVSWGPASTDGGTSYVVSRNGTVVASGLTGTSYQDSGVADGVPVTYTVSATYASGAQQSASYTFTPDWTAPTPPTLTAVTRSSTQVDLNWAASTDNVTGYAVSYTAAGGAPQSVSLNDPTSTSVSVTGLQPGTAYTFTVTATDVGGNTNSSSAPATTMVLSDGFESGSFASPWATPVTGNLTVQSATVHTGTWAAREQSTGSPSWVTATLSSTYRALHASAYVYITSHSTSASFFKLRGPGGEYIAYLYVNGANQLAVRNDAGLVTHPSTTVLANGRWYHVELWLDVDPGGPITIRAAVDGNQVTFSTPVGSTETLGTKLIGRITLGDDVSGRTYDVAIDDLTLDLGN